MPPPPNGDPNYYYYYGYDPNYYYDPYQTYSNGEETPTAETEAEAESEAEPPPQTTALQAIKSVSDIHLTYDVEDDSKDDIKVPNDLLLLPQKPKEEVVDEDSEDDDDDDEDTDEDDAVTTADNSEHVPHQLSIIFEESDARSDVTDRRREASVASEDDSSTTIAVDSGDDEETVTVRLPLRFQFSRTENDEDVTTLIVGDSQIDKCNVSVTVNMPNPKSNSGSELNKAQVVQESEESSDDSSDDSSESDEEVSVSATLTLHSKTEDSGVISEQKVEEEKELTSEIVEKDTAKQQTEEGSEEEEEEEEEADSGVTSQTDTESECFHEVRRSKYQRAATHSRLFKLLHDECSNEDEDDEEEVENNGEDIIDCRKLTLPLTECSRSSFPDSFSSGIASPASTPPRRTKSAAQSEMSTPNDGWTDYVSYYRSWEDRSHVGGGLGGRITPVSSLFPLQPPRCPMTPVMASSTRGERGVANGAS